MYLKLPAGSPGILAPTGAEVAQEGDDPLLVGGGHRRVERALIEGLGQQLGDVPVDVGLAGAVAHGRRAELAGVHVLAARERRRLGDAVDVGLLGAAAHGPVAAAGAFTRLDDRALVARLAELVRGRQAGDAGAQDHDPLRGAAAYRVEHHSRAAGDADPCQEVAAAHPAQGPSARVVGHRSPLLVRGYGARRPGPRIAPGGLRNKGRRLLDRRPNLRAWISALGRKEPLRRGRAGAATPRRAA